MKTYAFVILLTFCQLKCTLSNDSVSQFCGRIPELRRHKRIVGYDTVHNETTNLPWLAALRLSHESHLHCTGSIISQRYVLTAAHCAYEIWTSRFLRIMEEFRSLMSLQGDYLRFSASRFIVYFGSSDWTRGTFRSTPLLGTALALTCNDIALFELDAPLQFTDRIQPVCLPDAHFREAKGGAATVAGWGRSGRPGGALSIGLRRTQVHFDIFGDQQRISNAVRKNPSYKKFVGKVSRTRSFCPASIYASSFGHGVDQGDSGGPMMIVQDGRWTQIGVNTGSHRPWTSNYSQQWNSGTFVVATRVPAYCDWINNVTGCEAMCRNDVCPKRPLSEKRLH